MGLIAHMCLPGPPDNIYEALGIHCRDDRRASTGTNYETLNLQSVCAKYGAVREDCAGDISFVPTRQIPGLKNDRHLSSSGFQHDAPNDLLLAQSIVKGLGLFERMGLRDDRPNSPCRNQGNDLSQLTLAHVA